MSPFEIEIGGTETNGGFRGVGQWKTGSAALAKVIVNNEIRNRHKPSSQSGLDRSLAFD